MLVLPVALLAQPLPVETAAQAIFGAKCVACHGSTAMPGLDLRGGGGGEGRDAWPGAV